MTRGPVPAGSLRVRARSGRCDRSGGGGPLPAARDPAGAVHRHPVRPARGALRLRRECTPRPGRPGPGTGSGRVRPEPAGVRVYLMVVQYLPVHRCVELLESLTGATPSVGFVHGMLTRAAGLLAEVDKRIRALITLAYAVCCDETPLRVGPKHTEAGPEEGREVSAGRLHRALHALPARRPRPGHVQGVRPRRPDRVGDRARPLPELRLRRARGADPPAVLSASCS